jgi:5'-nucleotidase
MKTKAIPYTLLFLLALILAPVAFPDAAPAFSLRIIHVNDTHSHLEPMELKVDLAGQPIYVTVGGYARLDQAVQAWRKEQPQSLFLHAGDAVQGTLYYNQFLGAADMDLLNQMGLDAMVVGNHEFDRGLPFLLNMTQSARFPFLLANLNPSQLNPEQKTMFRPWLIREINGRKVGVIGLAPPEIPQISSPGRPLDFGDPTDVAKKAVADLTGQGVDIIIALTHLGLLRDMELARDVPGLDVIVGGHSHTLTGDLSGLGIKTEAPYPVVVKNGDQPPVYVVTAWEWGKTMGRLDLEFDAAGRATKADGAAVILAGDRFQKKGADGRKVDVSAAERENILAALKGAGSVQIVGESPAILEKLAQYRPGVDKLRNQVVARVEKDLFHIRQPGTHPASGRVLAQGSETAPLAADSMFWKLRTVEKDAAASVVLAVQNGGGVRTDLGQGDLTVAEVIEMLPFNNTLVVLTLTGDQIRAAVNHGLTRKEGSFPYLAGCRAAARKKGDGWELMSLDVKEGSGGWTPLKDDGRYRVVTNSFLASGGDGYTMFKEAAEKTDTGFIDADAFVEYAQAQGILKPLAEPALTFQP